MPDPRSAGEPGEKILEQWEEADVTVRRYPDDRLGLLRISIGGGHVEAPGMAYCTFRGDRTECIGLLKQALYAMERPGA